MKKFTKTASRSAMFLSISMLAASAAWGQTPPDTSEPQPTEAMGGPIVGDGQGLGPNERSIGNAIQTVCPRLVNERPLMGGVRGPDEIDLQRRCTEVARARGQGVPVEGVNLVLREWNIDEAAGQNRSLVELGSIASNAVLARLKQLRVADAGRTDEVIAYQSGPSRFNYHLETGGAAGDSDFSKWSYYVNGEIFNGDRDQTPLEAGFDIDGFRLTVGADYRVNSNTFAGGSLGYVTSSADFDNGSELDADSTNLTFYGTSYMDDGTYFQGSVGFGSNDYSQSRTFRYSLPAAPPPIGTGGGITVVNQVAQSDTDGDQFVLSGGVGRDIDTGNGIVANWSANLSYLDASVDGFTETVAGNAPGSGLALRVRDQDIESLQSSLGVQVSKAISTARGVMIPFGRMDWVHEFKNDSRTIVASFANDRFFENTTTFALTTEEPDQDYFRLGGGVSTVLPGGLQAFVALDAVVALSDLNYYSLTAGIRKEL